MNDLLFAAIDLTGRHCTVIGGGSVAERKIKKLISCGASVTAVAPKFTETLAIMAKDGIISAKKRCYEKGNLTDAFLVVIATDDDSVNMEALDEAKEAGILVNAAFDKRYGDVYFTATKEIDDFTVAVISKDKSPGESVKLLEEITKRLEKE